MLRFLTIYRLLPLRKGAAHRMKWVRRRRLLGGASLFAEPSVRRAAAETAKA